MEDELQFLKCAEIHAAIATLVVSHSLTLLAILAFRWARMHKRLRTAAAFLTIPAAIAILIASGISGHEVFVQSYGIYLQRVSHSAQPVFLFCSLPGMLRASAPFAGMLSATAAYPCLSAPPRDGAQRPRRYPREYLTKE